MKQLRLIVCWLRGHVVPIYSVGKNELTGYGDNYDQFGKCVKCKTLCHRDTHIYGDCTWRTTAIEMQP
jgi:hypothetical protein